MCGFFQHDKDFFVLIFVLNSFRSSFIYEQSTIGEILFALDYTTNIVYLAKSAAFAEQNRQSMYTTDIISQCTAEGAYFFGVPRGAKSFTSMQ